MAKSVTELDSPWKDIIERYFEEFMVFFFPDIHQAIDWNQPYQFLDKEFQKLLKESEMKRRLLDKLVKV